jgi:beta-glucosidase
LDSSPGNPYSNIGIADTVKPWTKVKAKELALKATRKSIVLLKNSDSVLPLHKEKINSIAVIGPNSNNVISDWYGGTPPYKVSILDGIKNSLNKDVKINYALSNKADSAVIAAEKSDVAIVCIGNHPLSHNLDWGKNHVFSDGREEVDRQAISCEQEDLVKLVYNANPRTILILVSSFPYAINWSQEHIPAILQVTHSSQELGNGVADIIFGVESPAGRLVQTWSRSIEHLMPILEYDITKGKTYMYNENQPLYEFGFGLTYSLFEYSNISIDREKIGIQDTANILFELKNIGDYDSDEVVQLYVSFPESLVKRPIISLKGFSRVHVKSGETKNVLLKLCADDLSYWDVENKKFVLEDGKIKILIGSSSKDIRIVSTLFTKNPGEQITR